MTSMDRSSRQVNKETAILNDTLDQKDLIDIFRSILPQSSRLCILYKCTWNFARKTTLGHKTSLNKFKKNEIISSIFSNHNGMKLEINHKKKPEKHTKT